MNKKRYQTLSKTALLGCGFLCAAYTGWAQEEEEEVFELSPFAVDASEDSGYYASQTMAGGRLSGSLKDTGAAVQVITKEFMDDIGATGIEELLQYTTSSEVAGILGNFTGADEGGLGETNVGSARRDPDGATRVRGMAPPDRTRNFFITDIPFDSYNTDRIDINRGANSFLFGLASPAGIINNGMAQAEFRDSNEFSFRVGSGGRNPTYRGSFKLNRVVLEDKLAVHVAGLMDRTEYRQRPTYKNDDRYYTAFSYRPFGNANTVIRGHMEKGDILGNAPDVLLPQQNFDTFLETPARMNTSIFNRDFRNSPTDFGSRNQEGPTQGQFNNNGHFPDEEKQAFLDAGYIIRNSGGPEGAQYPDLVYRNIRWGGGAYGHVWDGNNGSLDIPSFSYSDQIPGLALERNPRGDELPNYWSGGYRVDGTTPAGNNGGAPQNLYPGNLGEIMGVGWLDHGFTDLDTFDFSRNNLGWDNDYYSRDFFNYNFALEQTFWEGKGGFSIEYDFQDLYRDSFTALNGGNSVITFDVNETLLLPEDPNYIESGNFNPMPNPNFGRPVIMTKSGRRTNDDQRTAKRFTGFVKHDFRDSMNNDNIANFLGEHTFTVLADSQRHHEILVNWREGSYGANGYDVALHIGPANARQVTNNARNTPNLVYIGPPQLNAWDDYTKVSDFIIEPARYNLSSTTGKTWRKLTWDLGPDSTPQALADDTDRSNGNESWQWVDWTPLEVATKNVRRQQTTVDSMAVNTQSRMLNDILVVNMGYREDTVENWLNTEPPLVGLDELSDVRPSHWLLEDGTFNQVKKDIFGYGAVVYWPKDMIPLPEMFDDITFHYNTSDNFIPSLERVDEYREPIESQFGDTTDYGISAYMWNNKVVARINWYDANLINATSPVSGVYNRNMIRIPQWYGRLNRRVQETDAFKIDGEWDAELLADEFELDPDANAYIVNDGEYATIEEAADALWPNLDAAAAAREPLDQFISDERFIEAFNLRFLPDGDINSQWAGSISDTTDINSKGMEAEIILNPTKSWRIAFNAAQSQTTLSNIAPRLTEFVNFLIPYVQDFGYLDWSNPAEEVNGATFTDQIGDRLLEYFYVKNLEGKPTAEQREWRFNLITNYQFREGPLSGFSVGGAARWQDDSAAGFPIYFDDALGFYQPDVENPWRDESDLAVDLTFGYRKKFGDITWRTQINMRNVHNWDNTDVDITRFQPDGRPARARYAPPRQIMWTNTFQF